MGNHAIAISISAAAGMVIMNMILLSIHAFFIDDIRARLKVLESKMELLK